MTALRIIDSHLELANIGTKTHANIEGHIQGIGNYAFPAADGGANQILETDGADVLSWCDKPAVFACGDLSACSLNQLGTRPHSQLTGIGVSDHHTDHQVASAENADFKSVNIALGEALKENSSPVFRIKAPNNVLVGKNAGINMSGSMKNVCVGEDTGTVLAAAHGFNIFMGYEAGKVTNSSYNLFIGSGSGKNNSSGTWNFGLGTSSGHSNTSGSYNVWIGTNAGLFAVSGSYNFFLGTESGKNNINGSYNFFAGYKAGMNATGSRSILIGHQTGYGATGSDNVFIGYESGKTETGSNLLYINNSNAVTPLIWGDFTNHKVGIYMKPAVAKFGVAGIVEYADNAAAVTAGLSVGEFYRTGDLLKIVH